MAQHGEKPVHGHIDKIENENGSTNDVITNKTLSSECNDKISAEQNGIAIINISEKEKKRILRKVDWRLVPLLAFPYLVSFVDRSSIGNAKITGMTKDLKMVGLQYNIAVTLFYVPYSLLEVPSNKYYTQDDVTVAMDFDHFVRPGSNYDRYGYQRRLAIFTSMASMAGAFSGLLAFAIEKMDNIGGRSGWQWIFTLEGLVPIIFSLFTWKLLPDSPESAKFLEQHEKEYIVNRIAAETGSGHGQFTNKDKIRYHHIWSAFKEWKIWGLIIVYLGNSVGVCGFTVTVPTVIEDLGYSAANAQLLTIPIYVFAVVMILSFAWLSDRYQVRWIFIVVGNSIAGCGFIAQLVIPHPKYPGITYGFLFPIAGGMYSGFPPMISWAANKTSPSSKRAVAMALLISVGGMGSIAGSNVYLAREAPKYHTGFGVSFAFFLGGIIMTRVLRFAYARENSKRDRMQEEMSGEQGMLERYSRQELLDMGDKSPFFRFLESAQLNTGFWN